MFKYNIDANDNATMTTTIVNCADNDINNENGNISFIDNIDNNKCDVINLRVTTPTLQQQLEMY